MIDKFERIKLGHFPTPIEYLKNITEHLNGPQIYIKKSSLNSSNFINYSQFFEKNIGRISIELIGQQVIMFF